MRATGGDGGHASPMVHVRGRLGSISGILSGIPRPPTSTAPRPSSCSRRGRKYGRGRAWRPRGGEIDADGQHMIGSGSTVHSMRPSEGPANSWVTHPAVRRFLRTNAFCDPGIMPSGDGHVADQEFTPPPTARGLSARPRHPKRESPLEIGVSIYLATFCDRNARCMRSARSSSCALLAARTAILP
jgi:hypothetical protein